MKVNDNTQNPSNSTPESGATSDSPRVISRTSFSYTPKARQIPAEEPVVSVPATPTARTKSLDERYIPLTDLPSQFRFYSFDVLHIRRLSLGDLNRIHAARTSKNLRMFVDCIDNLIDQSAYDLTVGDFMFILFWLRLNCYKKKPMRVLSKCTAKEHVEKVERTERAIRQGAEKLEDGSDIERDSGGKPIWTASSLDIGGIVSQSDLQIHNPAPDIDAVTEQLFDEYGVLPYPTVMADHIEKLERYAMIFDSVAKDEINQQQAMVRANEIMEQDWIYKYAALLNREHGLTLADRANFLLRESEAGNLPVDITTDLDAFLKKALHGVNQYIMIGCAGCGMQHRRKVDVDILDFFP